MHVDCGSASVPNGPDLWSRGCAKNRINNGRKTGLFPPQSLVVPRNQRQINKYYLGQVNYWATAFYCRFFVFLYLVFLE